MDTGHIMNLITCFTCGGCIGLWIRSKRVEKHINSVGGNLGDFREEIKQMSSISLDLITQIEAVDGKIPALFRAMDNLCVNLLSYRDETQALKQKIKEQTERNDLLEKSFQHQQIQLVLIEQAVNKVSEEVVALKFNHPLPLES